MISRNSQPVLALCDFVLRKNVLSFGFVFGHNKPFPKLIVIWFRLVFSVDRVSVICFGSLACFASACVSVSVCVAVWAPSVSGGPGGGESVCVLLCSASLLQIAPPITHLPPYHSCRLEQKAFIFACKS